jgi:membrane-bound serine protease (ClpP class)
MFLGSLMLVQSPEPFLRVSLSVIIPGVLVTALFFIFAVGVGLKAQVRKPVTGMEGLVGETGQAFTEIGPRGGKALVHGEIWTAVSDKPIRKGKDIRVEKVNRLKIVVREINHSS